MVYYKLEKKIFHIVEDTELLFAPYTFEYKNGFARFYYDNTKKFGDKILK